MREPWPRGARLYVFAALLLLPGTSAFAQTATTPGQLAAYSTIYSIGLEWDIANDSDHDARAQVDYRPSTEGTWRTGMPLVRVDAGRNMLAGSLFFLAPGTEYVVRVALTDPDGGSATRQVTVRTRPIPSAPSGGRVFHVVAGNGGGDGSPGSPFRGIAAAQAAAAPGDTFLLHAGNYGGRVVLNVPGDAGAYIAWRAAGDGEVNVAGIDIAASHLWLEGVTIRDQYYATRTVNAPANVVITRSFFYNNFYSIFLSSGGSDWYIADNTIVGSTAPASGSFEGEGIELQYTSGHTVAHNSITYVADGVSYPHTNVDIFGNDIFDTADDGIELDFGRANVRVWGNRIHNPHHNGISFQPQSGGPWYIIRNQIVGGTEAPLKFRTVDRFVLLHNTMVNWGGYIFCCQANDIQKAFARNNLWISADGGQMWAMTSGARSWRTDLDYDGFDWGSGLYPFFFDETIYYDVHSFAQASGHQAHGIRVHKDDCFADFRMSAPTPAPVPPHHMRLQPWCNAVDAGQVLPNVNDGYVGGAPDMGAHEYGAAAAVYGPRTGNVPPSVVLTSPSAGASFTAPASIALSASAGDTDGAVTRVEFYSGFTLIGTDATAPYTLGWSNVAAGSYSVSARVVDDDGATATSSAAAVTVAAAAAAPQASPLPDGWALRDVGAVGVPGSTSESGGTYTMHASGADVWGTADAFGYMHRALTGDGAIVARVRSLSDTDPWTKAGVMMRESLTPGSPHAFLFVTPGANGVAFQRRSTAGGTSSHTAGGAGAAPVWLRLTRAGNTISAARSADGRAWTTIGSATIAMPATIYVGLALSSHDNGALATGGFDNVAISAGSAPAAVLPEPWDQRDIGAVGVAGTISVGANAWVVSGSGADVWGTADAFHYVYRTLTGDGSVAARVTNMQAGDTWAKAGVMMRADLAAGAAHAFMLVTPGQGLALQRRRNTNGTTSHTSGGSGGVPAWVKLTRTGSTIVAFRSADGVTWTEVGRDTFTLPATIHVGVAVTSHDNSTLSTTTFEHVEVAGSAETGQDEGSGGTDAPAATAPWSSRDVGRVSAEGSALASGSGWNVTGSGADIWGTRDEFHYAYTTAAGDFTIAARVASVENVDSWTKAGLMVRESAGAAAAHASVFATPSSINGVAFQRRTARRGASSHTPGPRLAPGVWLRLRRQGATITAAYRQSSTDAWVTFASETIDALSDAVLVGLAVTSHQDGSRATAVFDSVTLTAGP